MGATQRERGGNAVLRHFDRTLVGVRLTEKPGEVDEDSLSDRYAGQSLRPPVAGIAPTLLNDVFSSSEADIAQIPQRAPVACGSRPAYGFRMGDEEGVVLLVHRDVPGHAVFKALLDGVVCVRVEEAHP